jgi:hypothetical protein
VVFEQVQRIERGDSKRFLANGGSQTEYNATKGKLPMSDKREATKEGGHMAADDRRTLEAIFHHPAPQNLSWLEVLRILTHLGSADEKTDGKYSLTINGNHLIFHKSHGKHLDARQVSDLRHYFAICGISSDNPYGTPATAEPSSVDVVVLIDHHGAKLYRLRLSSDQRVATVAPHDPHHFLHHLHHRDELREEGQRPPEDLTFYDRISEALSGVDRIVLLSHGTGLSNASNVLTERLKTHHPGIYARIVRQAEVNTSAMTEAEILAYGRQALTTDAQRPL